MTAIQSFPFFLYFFMIQWVCGCLLTSHAAKEEKSMLDLNNRTYIATFQQDAVSVAAEYGLGLEINHTCISEDLDPENREALTSAILRDLQACGGLTPLLHGPFTEIYPAAIDRRAREMARLRLDEAYQVCLAAGAKRMIVHTGWLPFIYFKEWQAQKAAAFWEDFMKDKAPDFEILVENVLEDEPLMLADFMSNITDPRISLCLDVGHANAAGTPDFPVEKWIYVLGEYIGHFHLHNNDGKRDSHSAFDKGSLDMDIILSAAENSCRPDVTFTIEARDCRSCARWLRQRGYIR